MGGRRDGRRRRRERKGRGEQSVRGIITPLLAFCCCFVNAHGRFDSRTALPHGAGHCSTNLICPRRPYRCPFMACHSSGCREQNIALLLSCLAQHWDGRQRLSVSMDSARPLPRQAPECFLIPTVDTARSISAAFPSNGKMHCHGLTATQQLSRGWVG